MRFTYALSYRLFNAPLHYLYADHILALVMFIFNTKQYRNRYDDEVYRFRKISLNQEKLFLLINTHIVRMYVYNKVDSENLVRR